MQSLRESLYRQDTQTDCRSSDGIPPVQKQFKDDMLAASLKDCQSCRLFICIGVLDISLHESLLWGVRWWIITSDQTSRNTAASSFLLLVMPLLLVAMHLLLAS